MKTTESTKKFDFVGRTINYKLFGEVSRNTYELFKEFEGKVVKQTETCLFLDCGEVLNNSEKISDELDFFGIYRGQNEYKGFKWEYRLN